MCSRISCEDIRHFLIFFCWFYCCKVSMYLVCVSGFQSFHLTFKRVRSQIDLKSHRCIATPGYHSYSHCALHLWSVSMSLFLCVGVLKCGVLNRMTTVCLKTFEFLRVNLALHLTWICCWQIWVKRYMCDITVKDFFSNGGFTPNANYANYRLKIFVTSCHFSWE